MITTATVREEVRNLLGAITHVDGTARLQTVSKAQNPLYWSLIYEFGKITGVPILLNTSFNNNAEPIVDSLDDAVTTFLTTEINYLVVGEYIVRKKQPSQLDDAYLHLAPGIPISRKLVKRRRGKGGNGRIEEVFEIESAKSPDFGHRTVQISAVMYQALQQADGQKDLRCLLRESGLNGHPMTRQLIDEVKRLWTLRVITMRPPCGGFQEQEKSQKYKHE
jgi:carbamoyltransferase